MQIVLPVTGLIFLIIGAESLVRGASRVASRMGISPLVIGLTVVAFGTSSPELAVSIESALSGQSNIAVGNVVGSNIFNVLFILGVSAMIVPLVVSRQLIRVDVPLMIILSIVTLALSLDGNFSRANGLFMTVGLLIYIWFLIHQSRKEKALKEDEFKNEFGAEEQRKSGWLKNIAMVVGGLVLLVLGSRWFVDGAVSFAQFLGVSELIIGLTIIAAGTSLPEVVTSIIAAIRGERDIAVGNVVGSNIFNIMGVLGIAGVVAPGGLTVSPALIAFDIPVMIGVALACLPIFFTGGVISKQEAVLFLAYYVAYTLYLVLAASQHASLPIFSSVMLFFVIPLTVAAGLLYMIRELKKGAPE
ncbi:MAG TPA: calcium/sodium antiporter [Balneolaceae bacterium]|nr:calcium/sodium antiporter [Balneolaceae bacterium]